MSTVALALSRCPAVCRTLGTYYQAGLAPGRYIRLGAQPWLDFGTLCTGYRIGIVLLVTVNMSVASPHI